ncbi:hypothetical protein D3C87_956760 [compost metagenome]|uniref:hypothetical protein n=1 Tax=Pseudomonas TaxID=286 RepID=UPI000F914626|nr:MULTISPECIES: hypothetical protein [Pseudomonas]UVL36370.1 hypothetical protein LOY43_08050 [Pseudomonas sp. B21-041]WPN76335.1 hypothetical protein QMK46_08170 [Pseudomonas germanica]
MKLLLFLTLVFSAAVNAMSGPALVADLNAKYQNNVAQCSNGTPAYYCSGVLLRAVDYSTFFKFWDYGSQATKLGSVAFTYIRSDVGSTALNGNRKSGFILKDQTSALAVGKAVSLRCIFPFPTESLNERADHGCGFAPKVAQADPDLANCAKLWGSPTTAAAWLKNFKEHDSLPKNQCSLSTVVAAQFKASLEAHKLMDATWTAKPTEVLVETWDESKPEKLPVEAVFYEASSPAKLADAQKFQREYYLETSLYVPIVKINMAAANKQIFSFDAKDQRFGQLVAERLNSRYNNVSNNCSAKPAYYCSGVIVRTTGAKPSYHSWNPSPTAINKKGVPFSYLRKDLGITKLAWGDLHGFIFKDFATAERLGTYPISLLCSFPTDAASWYRAGVGGCGAHSSYPANSRSCPEEGVTTLEKWKTHYRSVAGSGSFSNRNKHQCGFTSSVEQFAISLEARAHFEPPAGERPQHNEIIMSLWPQDIPKQLPLYAFFYLQRQDGGSGVTGAKYIQQDYFNMTGDVLPVIRVDLAPGAAAAFSFHEADQATAVKGR